MLGELVEAGKVRWIGSSTFAAWMVMEELAIARERNLPAFVSEQPPYNLLDRRSENELFPLCERYGLAVLPWSPLGGGVLTGRYDSADRMPEDSRAARAPAGARSCHRGRARAWRQRWPSWRGSAGSPRRSSRSSGSRTSRA